MTKHEAAVISAYTGVLIGSFADMHEYVEKLLGRPVWTHELASKSLCEQIKQLAKPDLLAIHEAVA